MSWKTYDAGKTGEDPSRWDEKDTPTKGLPQRGSRPALDLSPDNSTGDFSEMHLPEGNFYQGTFNEASGAKACMLDYDDRGCSPLNEPTPLRKRGGPDINGWVHVAADAYPETEPGVSEKGSEKR